jgi:hypothetical protein
MYGGCGFLFLSFIFNFGKLCIIISSVLIVISLLIAVFALRCPHCKKSAIRQKDLAAGIKSGKCTCSYCGEEIEIR